MFLGGPGGWCRRCSVWLGAALLVASHGQAPLISFLVIGENGRDRKTNCASGHEAEDAENGGDHNARSVTHPQRVNGTHTIAIGKISSDNRGVRARKSVDCPKLKTDEFNFQLGTGSAWHATVMQGPAAELACFTAVENRTKYGLRLPLYGGKWSRVGNLERKMSNTGQQAVGCLQRSSPALPEFGGPRPGTPIRRTANSGRQLRLPKT
jgi:hypothetical protein